MNQNKTSDLNQSPRGGIKSSEIGNSQGSAKLPHSDLKEQIKQEYIKYYNENHKLDDSILIDIAIRIIQKADKKEIERLNIIINTFQNKYSDFGKWKSLKVEYDKLQSKIKELEEKIIKKTDLRDRRIKYETQLRKQVSQSKSETIRKVEIFISKMEWFKVEKEIKKGYIRKLDVVSVQELDEYLQQLKRL